MPARFSAHKIPFVFAIFFGAFLLFWVQLIIGKYILPWFGGTPAVWTTCMVFFQVLLLGGYAYAHLLSEHASTRAQGLLHCALLLVAIAQIAYFTTVWSSAVTPGPAWKPASPNHPAFNVLKLLAVAVGLPYFALSATGPLMQAWYKRTSAGDSPFRLYSVSNLGSFLALFSFPVFLEPRLPLHSQGRLWSVAYLLFALATAVCAQAIWSTASQAAEAGSESAPSERHLASSQDTPPGPSSYFLWFALSACASVVFLATTNQLCQDVAVVPMLWVLPLGVYLLSFILCFEHQRWYARQWFHAAFGLALLAACFLLYEGAIGSILAQAAIYLFALFVVCMICHGELVRVKPHARFITFFYLAVAAGGAFGGIFVGLLAPHVFRGFWEYQLGLWAAASLLTYVLLREPDSWLYRSSYPAPVLLLCVAALLPEAAVLARVGFHAVVDHFPAFVATCLALYMVLSRRRVAPERVRRQAVPLCSAAALLVLGLVLTGTAIAHTRTAIVHFRNFYGALAVTLQDKDDPARSAVGLLHGRVAHGFQLQAENLRRTPTAYYSKDSGIGLAIHQAALASASARRNLRVGVVGLGIGTIAAYGKTGDIVRFYEINPKVVELASSPAYFTFLSDSAATIQIVPGDARLSLENEADRGELQNFDILAVDAFSGDSIPVHLLTSEAFQVYLKHLRQPAGVLAFHITNTYLDLRPVLRSAAERAGFNGLWIHNNGDGAVSTDSDWVLLSQEKPSEDGQSAGVTDLRGLNLPAIRPWTDEYSNLVQILRK